jgi:hypothetical protein
MVRAMSAIASLVFLRAFIKASLEKFGPVFSSVSVFIFSRPLLWRHAHHYGSYGEQSSGRNRDVGPCEKMYIA